MQGELRFSLFFLVFCKTKAPCIKHRAFIIFIQLFFRWARQALPPAKQRDPSPSAPAPQSRIPFRHVHTFTDKVPRHKKMAPTNKRKFSNCLSQPKACCGSPLPWEGATLLPVAYRLPYVPHKLAPASLSTSFIYSFIHSLQQHLLSTCCMPGMGSRNVSAETWSSGWIREGVLGRGTSNEQMERSNKLKTKKREK